MSKICKKRVHRNDKNNLPWDFKKCPRSLYFPLLSPPWIGLKLWKRHWEICIFCIGSLFLLINTMSVGKSCENVHLIKSNLWALILYHSHTHNCQPKFWKTRMLRILLKKPRDFSLSWEISKSQKNEVYQFL